MRVLLSTVGTRGEVQPVVAVATRLRSSGHEAVVCAPPDFRAWVESLGIPFVPVGPELRGTAEQGERVLPTPEQRRQMIDGTVAAQFAAVAAGADGCDAVVGGGALAIAAHSVAEHRGIGYVYASFCPITLPSRHHAPPVFGILGEKQPDGTVDNATLWAEDARRWNLMWGEAVNSRRAELGLAPVADVRDHVFTARPWLAADPTLAPWPDANDPDVFQSGAWILPDDRPLDPELEAFLNAGEPPVYLGFGSIAAPGDITSNVVEAARALGRRTIVSRGWADLAPVDGAPDCLAIGEVNQQALFPRVAAVVHHGGAGTTTAAAAAGTPQVLVPQVYDQFYFAGRVEELGIGSAHRDGGSLHAALAGALGPEVATTARALASAVRTDGATTAARRLVEMTRIA
ncbi:glycosyltransferase [Pseudonocardia cypriaca]|uniref:Vancomycin aglycone glucosyltransferase n=1 Tax=Pseudonocardia cypriaca TaxID=882449 RepID=A0A543GG14_9PSEU|nr:glycosyltransferase [Pseudonocardia cypriaca]TQM45019.1 vancomycin aglycone glucosyltransferase [Pseudonocardia cypriaca]